MKCKECNGTGAKQEQRILLGEVIDLDYMCPYCHGIGKIDESDEETMKRLRELKELGFEYDQAMEGYQ